MCPQLNGLLTICLWVCVYLGYLDKSHRCRVLEWRLVFWSANVWSVTLWWHITVTAPRVNFDTDNFWQRERGEKRKERVGHLWISSRRPDFVASQSAFSEALQQSSRTLKENSWMLKRHPLFPDSLSYYGIKSVVQKQKVRRKIWFWQALFPSYKPVLDFWSRSFDPFLWCWASAAEFP